ncbi:MAG: shikimate dehydrogenase [Rhizobiaceae bacterium]
MEFLSALTGSFSHPAAGNPTVAMVEAAYRHHGLDFRYINCDVAEDALRDAVRGARAMGWRGFNLSIPHKVTVIDHIDGLAESATIIGAVNCVRHDQGRLIGENTDGKGFVQSLDATVRIPGKRAVILGAGGAARAIAVELARAGADRITLINRTAAKAETIATLVSERTAANGMVQTWNEPLEIPDGADVLVNATSIGLYPEGGMPPVEFASLNPRTLVADVIVNPRDTPFLAMSKARGCKTIDGHGMLVNQAIIGVAHWTGLQVDGAVMKSTLESIFG